MCLQHPVKLYELLHPGISRDRKTFCGTNLLEEKTWNLKLPLKLTAALFMGLKRGCKLEDQVAFPCLKRGETMDRCPFWSLSDFT